jgi:hypothetical protein
LQKRQTEAAQRDLQAIKDGNEQMREQIIAIQGGQAALDEYTKGKLQAAAATKDLDAAQREAEGASAAEVTALRESAKLLRERAGLIGDMRLAEKLRDEAKAIQDVKNMFADALVDPLTDFVTGTKTAREALRAFADDLTRMITRIAAQKVANSIFGGTSSSGPDIFSIIAKLMAGSTAGSASMGVGEYFASGGISKGGFAVVGERGPELVSLPTGARVHSNAESKKIVSSGATNVTQIFHVPARADTQTIRQQAKAGYRAATGAARRG